MNFNRILGLLVLVIGIICLGFGLNSTNAVSEQLVEGVTGRYTEHTMWYILGGISAIIVGGALFLTSRQK